MSAAQIARLAWSRKDTTAPLDTILDALGLDHYPQLSTDGPAAVNRCAECLDAFKALVKERTQEHRDALPEGLREERGERTPVPCQLDGCEVVMQLAPWDAKRRQYCCLDHAGQARSLDHEREEASV